MKKLFATLSLLFLLPVIVCAAGCKPTEWEEVCGIEYTTEEGSNTVRSTCFWNATHEGYIALSDYHNVPEECRTYDFFRTQETLGIKRNSFISTADNMIGKTYYFYCDTPNKAEKITINSYLIKYVKIRFMPDNHIEIDYDGTITSILPLSYEVTYFED